mmetsp:Transcript_52995/g.102286  ORF Transcript_52995/g.102286 Transcript_52995/m.102286 type:complete len:543 (-) Transcript_52995:79-1707(-)
MASFGLLALRCCPLSLVSFGAVALTFSGNHHPPPTPPADGVKVLQSVSDAKQQCHAHSDRETNHLALAHDTNAENAEETRRAWRRNFVCMAGCSEREPELERSLSPFADWSGNTSGLEMLEILEGFCHSDRSCKDSFVMVVLWRGSVHLKACGASNLKEVSLYLIGPEDLSLVITQLLAVQRVAALPSAPVVFGLYLSDYTCLADRHLVGPGIPIFAYLGRDTSWVIPWPNSFMLHTTYQIENWHRSRRVKRLGEKKQHDVVVPWSDRVAKAYWIGTVTGPWEFAADASLMAVPRMKLLRLTSEHPDKLQAEWSGVASYGISWVKDSDSVAGFLANKTRSIKELTGVLPVSPKPLQQWANFKYYLNVDGVVMGGRLNKLLALGGVVLQHKAGYREHVDMLMKPYEHYVPIEYDLSDLAAKVEWLQQNDAEAQRIASQGRSLAESRMRLEDHLCYIWRALEALGTTAARREIDTSAMERRLQELRFHEVTVVEEDMRKTLERFWGSQLEKVQTGDRVMTASGIQLIQWAWDRYSGMWKQAHGA